MPSNAPAVILAIILYLTATILGQGRSGPPPDDPAPPWPPASATVDPAGRPAQVSAGSAALRAGPSVSAPKVSLLDRGTSLTVVGEQGEWYEVRLNSGLGGWIWKPLVTLTPWPVPATAARRPRGSQTGRTVVGYYVFEGSSPSYASMVRHASALTAVAPWAWGLTAEGRLVGSARPDELAAALRAARSLGLQTYGLVHNFHQGRFDGEAVHRLLSDPERAEQAIGAIAEQARASGMNGIVLNLENVPPPDRGALTDFVRGLREALGREGMWLAVAVPAKTGDNPSHPLAGAYDYRALGLAADQLWLMTYDEHYRLGPPGPVASWSWVEQVVRYAVSVVEPSRVVLGLPAYGYEWPRSGGGRALSYGQAMAALRDAHALLRWHPVHKVPYFVDGQREVWFENRHSAAFKVQLVRRYGLAGVAVWRLGQEDPGLWEVIARALLG